MKFLLVLIFAVLGCFTLIGAAKSPSCLQPHSLNGDGRISCEAYFPSWSFNSEEQKCVGFIYGGCGGNQNRFRSLQECEDTCMD